MYLQSHIYKNIPVSFDFITTWNQGVFLCSPCIMSEELNWGQVLVEPIGMAGFNVCYPVSVS